MKKPHLPGITGTVQQAIDRPFGESLSAGELHSAIDSTIRSFLPTHGHPVHKKQLDLAAKMLTAICHRHMVLVETEAGDETTYTYLTAGVLSKRSRVNDFWNHGYYPAMSYLSTAHMPIVISASSVARQRAIARDYIPELSRILMEHGVIRTPLTSVIRKGKEQYVCERKLRAYIPRAENRQQLLRLLTPATPIDLFEIHGLTPHTRQKICVSGRCPSVCPHLHNCRYWQWMNHALSPSFDIQVCNHHYLLTDALRRTNGQHPLIPNYQLLIVDDARTLPQVARQIYRATLSDLAISGLAHHICDMNFQHKDIQAIAHETAKKLSGQSGRLFRRLDASRPVVTMNADTVRHLHNIHHIASRLTELLLSAAIPGKGGGLRASILWDLKHIQENALRLVEHKGQIYWLEKRNHRLSMTTPEILLCGVPENVDTCLHRDLWHKGFPVILIPGHATGRAK
jgi:ATP-dependent DNA helicase DinG